MLRNDVLRNSAGVRGALRTPTVLVWWMLGLAVCALALWLVPAAGLGAARGGFGALGSDAAPGAVAAARLCDDLADLDGSAATMLLVGDDTDLPRSASDADQAYANDLADAQRQLELIGSRIDAIPGGAAALVAVQTTLNQYSQYIGQARYADGPAQARASTVSAADALSRYQAGSSLMHASGTGLLAEAQTLLADAQDSVQSRYDGALGTIGRLRLWASVLGVVVVLVLLAAQVDLARRFRRRVNPPLAFATVLTVIVSILLLSALDAAHTDYEQQKADAYDSIIDLWQSRATAADMYASQSRYLLDAASAAPADRATAAAEQARFDTEARQTAAEAGTGSSFDRYRAAVDAQDGRLEDAVRQGRAPEQSDTGDGFLGRELANLTFPGEQRSATAAFHAYGAFIDDDADFRALIAKSGPGAAAAQYVTGVLDRGYTAYLGALDDTISLDQQQLTAATARGGVGLGPWLWMPAGWALATAALVLLGLLPRLREYRRG